MQEALERDINDLRHTVYGGHGQSGIKSRVERIEVQIDTAVKILWSLLVLAVPSAVTVVGVGLTIIFK